MQNRVVSTSARLSILNSIGINARQTKTKMDSDDEGYEVMGADTSEEETICGKKNSSFEALSTMDIAKLMNQYIDDVMSIVQLPRTTIRILLSHTKWDKYELLSKLTDENQKNRQQFFAKANVADPLAKSKLVKKSSRKKITCAICYSDIFQKHALNLMCGHEYCKDCWRQYLTIKIADDGGAEAISCPTEKCGTIVDDDTIMHLISDESVRQKYQHLMTNSFVEWNHSLRWCPAAGCTLAIKVNQLLAYKQKCTCLCGYSFCFNCGASCHDPLSCSLVAKWLKDDNDETVLYITKHTKGCPKCKTLIEKNGGCNHMTCGKCSHEFCWLCFGNWKNHKKCSAYRVDDNDEKEKKKWQHYLEQYLLLKQSLSKEKLLESEFDEKVQQFLEMGISWNDFKFMKKALKILCECRQNLMYMCVFAYYVRSNNQKEIFEMNQFDLQTATEALSRYFEQEITTDNAENIINNVNNKVRFCERRQIAMNEHVYEGFEKNWWKFNQNE